MGVTFQRFKIMNILFFASDYKIGLSTLLTDQLLALHRNDINVYPVAYELQKLMKDEKLREE